MNIVANLAAAAIIYLVGIGIGFLPKNAAAATAAVTFLASLGGIILMSLTLYVMISIRLMRKPRMRYFRIASYLFASTLTVSGIFFLGLPLGGDHATDPQALIFYIPGVSMLIFGIYAFWKPVIQPRETPEDQ
nr:hypothetical protein GCM10020063_010660 [Dactylosporangium thailandense]